MEMRKYTSAEMADRLNIKTSTLRKYSLLLEKYGYTFQRNKLGQRIYSDGDVSVLESMIEMKNNGLKIEEAAVMMAFKPSNAEKKIPVVKDVQDIEVKEYKGQRVLTFKDIDEVHGRPYGTAKRNFVRNKHHLIEGVDYFIITRNEIRPEYGFCYNAPSGTLLTESGYLLLVKSFTDELAWKVQRKLVNNYFRAKEFLAHHKPTTQAELLLMYAQQFVEAERKLKLVERKVNNVESKVINVEHRINNLDHVNTVGDPQQKLNAMIKKYAFQNGFTFSKAWSDFVKAYNTAYNTNLKLRINNYKTQHGFKKLTIPQYLSIVGQLEDAIRVVDKMLNQEGVV